MTSDAPTPSDIPAIGVAVHLSRAEVVTITDALALLAVEHHRQRVLAHNTTDELAAVESESEVDALRLRLEQALLDI